MGYLDLGEENIGRYAWEADKKRYKNDNSSFIHNILIKNGCENQNKIKQCGKRRCLNTRAHWVMNKPKTFLGSDLCRR